jgi:hypothetical protein
VTIKEVVELAQPFIVVASSILVPLIVAYFGNKIATANKESENRVKYVELAVSILRTEPKPETKLLREWAVGLLDDQAPVKLSLDAKKQMLEQPLLGGVLSGNVTLDGITASGTIHGSPPKT